MLNLISSSLLAILLTCCNVGHAHDGHSAENHDEQVQQLMKSMQRSYRSALRSEDIEQLTPVIAQMIEITRQGLTLHYGFDATEHTDYQNGMRQLRADLERLQLAVAANNFPLAKSILNQQIKATRRQSHDKFGVDED